MMKKESPNAQVLRWMADGEIVQVTSARFGTGVEWFDCSESEILSVIAADGKMDPSRSRIKPRAIKIGQYEVAEPMRVDPENGTKYFTLNPFSAGFVRETHWYESASDLSALKSGMCWLKREDAELAAKAITELLTGKQNDE